MKIVKVALFLYFVWVVAFAITSFKMHIPIRLAYWIYPMGGSYCDFGGDDYHPFLEIVDFDGRGIIYFYKDKIVTKFGE